jgi:hypothetical protein
MTEAYRNTVVFGVSHPNIYDNDTPHFSGSPSDDTLTPDHAEKLQQLLPPSSNYDELNPPPALPVPSLAHLKGTGLKNVGKDKNGRVIPHVRSELLAQKICELVACGASANDIAVHFNIRPGLLKQCYATELEAGAFAPNMAVAGAILDRAKRGDPRLAIYWTKARMGWRDGDGAERTDVSPLNIHIHL